MRSKAMWEIGERAWWAMRLRRPRRHTAAAVRAWIWTRWRADLMGDGEAL